MKAIFSNDRFGFMVEKTSHRFHSKFVVEKNSHRFHRFSQMLGRVYLPQNPQISQNFFSKKVLCKSVKYVGEYLSKKVLCVL